MPRALPALIAIVLAVYCLVEVVQSQSDQVRLVPRWAWAIIIIAIPIVGPIGWLALGRPQRSAPDADEPAPGTGPGAGGRPVAPDDDPEFLEQLKRQSAQREQEEKLRRWEQDLQRREQQLDEDDDTDNTQRGTDDAGTDDGESSTPDQPTGSADDDPGNPSSGR